MTADPGAAKADADAAAPSSALHELLQFARAAQALLGAHRRLLRAELGLARSAATWLLVAGLVVITLAVAFGFTVLGLLGVLLAGWLHSWPLALAVLAAVQLLLLAVAIAAFRRCLHWLSLPASRRAWGALLQMPHAAGSEETPP
jgi:hypothetical protein